MSVLNHQTRVLQKEINKINEIANFLHEMNNNSPDLIKFNESYKKYYEIAEKCNIKEIKSNILIINLYRGL